MLYVREFVLDRVGVTPVVYRSIITSCFLFFVNAIVKHYKERFPIACMGIHLYAIHVVRLCYTQVVHTKSLLYVTNLNSLSGRTYVCVWVNTDFTWKGFFFKTGVTLLRSHLVETCNLSQTCM